MDRKENGIVSSILTKHDRLSSIIRPLSYDSISPFYLQDDGNITPYNGSIHKRIEHYVDNPISYNGSLLKSTNIFNNSSNVKISSFGLLQMPYYKKTSADDTEKTAMMTFDKDGNIVREYTKNNLFRSI